MAQEVSPGSTRQPSFSPKPRTFGIAKRLCLPVARALTEGGQLQAPKQSRHSHCRSSLT
jgi:hypothetical protein